MRGAVLYGPRNVRFEERAAPTIIKPTDAVIRMLYSDHFLTESASHRHSYRIGTALQWLPHRLLGASRLQ